MKHHMVRYVLTGLLALAFGFSVAVAQDDEGKKEKGPSKADLKKYDANRDGTLDEAEMATMKAAKEAQKAAAKQERLDKYDANQDGKINKNESATEKADKAAAAEAKKAAREAKKAGAGGKK
ncbi:MAG: hypothetical protein Q8J74_14290 [Candidatus Didemnitutus sp.]|nr:hypothetical protein [Candidatus Didemnitutus sp.]